MSPVRSVAVEVLVFWDNKFYGEVREINTYLHKTAEALMRHLLIKNIPPLPRPPATKTQAEEADFSFLCLLT